MTPDRRFLQYLQAQGYPVVGVSGSGAECVIQFDGTATQRQVDEANAERATFDWRERVPKPEADIRAIVDAMTPEQRDEALSKLLVAFAGIVGIETTEPRGSLRAILPGIQAVRK